MERLELSYIRDFIIKGEVKEALEELLAILQSSRKLHGRLRDDVILLRTQLNDVERKENLNLISLDEAGRERAQLQKGILDVINSLEEPGYAPAVLKPGGFGSQQKRLLWAIPLLLVVVALIVGIVFRNNLFKQTNRENLTQIANAPAVNTETTPIEPTVQPIEPPVQTTPDITTSTGAGTSHTGHTGTSSQTGTVTKKPADLRISDWKIDPYPPTQQQPTRITVIIQNTGETPAKNFKVEWWAGVNFPGPEKTWTLSLGAGEQQRLIYTYPGYSSWYGRLDTKISVDPEQAIRDGNPANNTQARTISVSKKEEDQPQPPKKANLAITKIDFAPYPPVQGAATRVTVTVVNTGNEVAQNATVHWWAGVNFPSVEKTWTGLTVNPGASKQLTYTYPGYRSWYGSLQTKAIADPGGQIEDADRSNNTLVRTISVRRSAPADSPKADLSFVGWRFVPATPVEGQQTRVEFTIENKGTATASNFNIQWWAGVNAPKAAKTWTGITLRAGERKDFSFTYSGYPSWYSSLQTKIALDPEKRVDDKDRSNNEWIRTIKVVKGQ